MTDNTKMSAFKVGDRVNHRFLGKATVIKKLDLKNLYLIETDETPPVEYNMGTHKTAEFAKELEKL